MSHKNFKNIPILLLGLLVIIIWSAPIVFPAGETGVFDWDVALQRFEATRVSILQYGQWPGVNPWVEGGQPLISVPGSTILSPEGFLVLLFGAFWGLRLSVLVYIIIGFLGAWKLSKIFWPERFLRLIFALYVIANCAVAYHISIGHLCFQNFWYMPWLLYYILQVKEDKWAGLKAGIVFGLAFLSSAIYIVQYAALISAGLFAWLWLKSKREDSRAFWTWILLFLPICGALVFYRLTIILFTAKDFARVSGWQANFDLLSLLKYYLYPYTKLYFLKSIDNLQLGTWELSCYVGFVSVVLLGVSLKKGLRWWHAIVFMLIWATLGNDKNYYLMYWILKLPFFSSHTCFMRIRMYIPLFLGICAVCGLSYLWSNWGKHRVRRYIVVLLGVMMVVEVLVVSHQIFKLSSVSFAYVGDYNPGREFRNISALPSPKDVPWNVTLAYPAIRMNLGWLRGNGDSHIPANNIRVGYDEAGYIGEYCQNGKAVKPLYWSPNRIVFRNLNPAISLVLNMNPGNAWYSNGVQLFPQYRIVEPTKPFEVIPDAQGTIDLTYRYPGQRLGLLGTVAFLIISIMVILINRKILKKSGWMSSTNASMLVGVSGSENDRERSI